MTILINISYFLSFLLIILSIRSLASPKTARFGNILGMIGIGLAIIPVFISTPNHLTTFCTIILGGMIGVFTALKIKITSLPQMVAILNGLGGLAAVFIAISEILSTSSKLTDNLIGLVIGGIAFSGSIIAFAKLQNIISPKPLTYQLQHFFNFTLTLLIIISSILFLKYPNTNIFLFITFLVIFLGISLVLPIGGADMPIIISILNSCSGWASVGIGLSLNNVLLIIVGAIVGTSGTILSYIMTKAMNRSLLSIMFRSFRYSSNDSSFQNNDRTPHAGSPEEAAFIMENANKIIIVPGYGMAAAKAQYALKEMYEILKNKYQVEIKFAIHPVAGRMPGHMNVLLAEANIDYADVFEMNDINNEFASTDVAYIIGANDITNPIAKTDNNSPLYGMPILDVEKAKTVFFVKRSLAGGYSGVDNPLFYAPNTIMLYGDAKKVTDEIVKQLELS